MQSILQTPVLGASRTLLVLVETHLYIFRAQIDLLTRLCAETSATFWPIYK